MPQFRRKNRKTPFEAMRFAALTDSKKLLAWINAHETGRGKTAAIKAVTNDHLIVPDVSGKGQRADVGDYVALIAGKFTVFEAEAFEKEHVLVEVPAAEPVAVG